MTRTLGPARLPLPTGDAHIPVKPNAELAAGEGEVRVAISHFSFVARACQAANSPSTSPSRHSGSSCRRIGRRPSPINLAVENIGGEPGTTEPAWPPSTSSTSPRPSACSPCAAPPPASLRCATSSCALAVAEQAEPFFHVVESPYEDFDIDFTGLLAVAPDHAGSKHVDCGLARRRSHGLRSSGRSSPTSSTSGPRSDDDADPGRRHRPSTGKALNTRCAGSEYAGSTLRAAPALRFHLRRRRLPTLRLTRLRFANSKASRACQPRPWQRLRSAPPQGAGSRRPLRHSAHRRGSARPEALGPIR